MPLAAETTGLPSGGSFWKTCIVLAAFSVMKDFFLIRHGSTSLEEAPDASSDIAATSSRACDVRLSSPIEE